MIESIAVENVKGIVHQDIKLNAHPNTVTYVVAPNGTGKSSLAAAPCPAHLPRRFCLYAPTTHAQSASE